MPRQPKAAAGPLAGDLHVDEMTKVDPKRKKLQPGQLPAGVSTYLARLKELLKGKVDGAVFDEAVRSARGHAGGKASGKARRERLSAQEDQPSGVIVAYFLKPDEAGSIAMDGGEAPADLHITLAYLGDVDDLPDDVGERATAALSALSYMLGPIEIESTGVDRFEAEDNGGLKDVVYATVDDEEQDDDAIAPPYGLDLCSLQERICSALCAVGLAPRNDYGEWCPHITLAYVDPDAEVTVTLPDVVMKLDVLTLAVAGTQTTFDLRGQPGVGPGMMMAEHPLSLQMAEYVEPPATLPLLPRPGTYTHPRWGEIELSAERLDRFVSNFRDRVYQEKVPVDLEHETKLSGAAGWITGLVMNADGGVDGVVDWTDRGRSALLADRFAYVSPEWYDEWADPIGGQEYADVLIGAALTTRPFFKERALRAIAASEELTMADYTKAERDDMASRGHAMPDGAYPIKNRADLANAIKAVGRGGGSHDAIRSHIIKRAKALGAADAIPDNWAADGSLKAGEQEDAMADDPKAAAKTVTMTEEQATAQAKRFSDLEAKVAELETAKTATEKLAETQAEQLKSATETITSMTDAERTKRFTEEVTGKSASSDLRWLGEPGSHVAILTHLAKTAGEDSEVFKSYVTTQRAVAEQGRTSALFTEVGSGQSGTTGSAQERINKMTSERAATDKTTFREAAQKIAAEHPDLYRQASEESRVKV